MDARSRSSFVGVNCYRLVGLARATKFSTPSVNSATAAGSVIVSRARSRHPTFRLKPTGEPAEPIEVKPGEEAF